MASVKLLDIITVGLIATCLGASVAAVHFYQLGLEQPPTPNVDDQIGKLGMETFNPANVTFQIDSLIDLILLNSTSYRS